MRPLKRHGYYCTPKNSLTFATTGGDGVHFGIINGRNQKGNTGPIVMTVPMAFDKNNIIAAEDLDEFFSLGYYVGWFGLEEIAYDLEGAIDYFSKSDQEITKEEQNFLEILRKELSLEYIPLSKKRLKELEEMYFGTLETQER